jgi:hypothetical protein
MTYSTGSKERDTFLRRAIGEIVALKEPLSVEAIAANLPNDFELETEEAEGMCAAMGHLEMAFIPAAAGKPLIEENPEGQPFPKSLEKIEAAHASEAEASAEASADTTPVPVMTRDEASNAVLAAHNALGEARIAYRKSQEATRAARAALATSITVWQTGQPPYTREDMTRDFIRGSNAARAQRAANGTPPQAKAIGKSYIDRAAAYDRDNSAEGAARSRMQTGSHRGAFPKSMKGALNFDPRRGPVAKPPGQSTQ